MALNILFIAPSAYLLGGVQDWLYMTCLGLREKGHKVNVGVPSGKYHNPRLYNQAFVGLDAIYFTNNTRTREGRIRCLKEFLLENRCDLIVGVNIGDLYEAYSRVSKELGETRLVLSLHAIETNYFLDIKAYNSMLDAVITTNRLSQRMVQEMGYIEKDRVYYAQYGIEDSKVLQRIDTGVSQRNVRLAWVGRIEKKQKRVMDLIAIVQELDRNGSEYQLCIAGDGPDREELGQALRQCSRNPNIYMLGKLSKPELYKFYAQNDMLIITSEWETGPIIAWEAMAAGLVIVSSRYLGSKLEEALIDERTALLYEVGNASQASERIMRLYDSDLTATLTKKAKEVVTMRYSRKASIENWERILIAIVGREKKNKVDWVQHERRSIKKPSGRLERLVGVDLNEKVRCIIPGRQATDAGAEWPHSCHEIIDQRRIWEYAHRIENGIQTTWGTDI